MTAIPIESTTIEIKKSIEIWRYQGDVEKGDLDTTILTTFWREAWYLEDGTLIRVIDLPILKVEVKGDVTLQDALNQAAKRLQEVYIEALHPKEPPKPEPLPEDPNDKPQPEP